MKRLYLIAALTLAASHAALAQPYVNVTVGGAFAPGVYGQVVIGTNAPPPIVNVQPVLVGRPVYGVPVLYLYAPPEHQRDWPRFCARYQACGHPVQFVQVDPRNRWWEHHNQQLRGPGYYREAEPRHDQRNKKDRHVRDGRDGRPQDKRSDRQDQRHRD